MPNTSIRFGATAADTRDDIRDAKRAIEAQTAHGDIEAVQAWTERLNRLMDEAHEQAHRENELRWAAEQVTHVAADDGEVIADLLARVRRNWRLSREHRSGEYATFKMYSQWAGNAASELETEYGVEVAWTIDGGWTVDFEAGWTESGTD